MNEKDQAELRQAEIDELLEPLKAELEGGRDESHVYEKYGSAGNMLTEHIVALADFARRTEPELVLNLLREF
jgi:hypothetical protein